METNHDLCELIHHIDVLVDGKFVDELKSTIHKYRGSSNQRLIDVPKTLNANKIVEFPTK
jgi:anaerobic ribonucleoside-triphosphate reductase activating protein